MTVGGGAGMALGGTLSGSAGRFKIQPGWLLTGTWSRRLVDGVGRAPFLLIGLAFGASGASTRKESPSAASPETASLYALDLRVAVTLGKTFWNTLSPYVSARAFGGPVFWNHAGKGVIGGDTHHYQLAFGLAASLPRGFDVFADGAPLGERAFAFGAGKRF